MSSLRGNQLIKHAPGLSYEPQQKGFGTPAQSEPPGKGWERWICKPPPKAKVRVDRVRRIRPFFMPPPNLIRGDITSADMRLGTDAGRLFRHAKSEWAGRTEVDETRRSRESGRGRGASALRIRALVPLRQQHSQDATRLA